MTEQKKTTPTTAFVIVTAVLICLFLFMYAFLQKTESQKSLLRAVTCEQHREIEAKKYRAVIDSLKQELNKAVK